MKILNHRYFNPHWWVLRLAPILSGWLSPRLIMKLIATSAYFGGEKDLKRLDQWVPSDRFAIDVGAAHGVYSWYLCRLAKGCVSFEANASSAKILMERLPTVVVHNVALSNRQGFADLRIPALNGVEMAGLGTIEPENTLEGVWQVASVQTELSTLDAFDLPAVGFIKIDVEGHELAVLEGAEALILRDHPVLLIEAEDRHRVGALDSVAQWLSQRGYVEKRQTSDPQNHLFVHIGQ